MNYSVIPTTKEQQKIKLQRDDSVLSKKWGKTKLCGVIHSSLW